MIKKKSICLLLIFLFCFWQEASADNKQHFILIVVPDLSFREIEYVLKSNNPFLQTGALAGLNVRPDGPYSYLNNIVSLSTGTKGVGIEEWNSYEQHENFQGENVEILMKRWTGDAPKQGLVHPLLHKLQEKNDETTYKAQIGLLGEMLKKNQVDRYVLGHSDKGEEKIRYGSLFTIDQKGETLGDLSCCVKNNASAPFGMEMDELELLKKIDEILPMSRSSLIVIEWGDLYRMYGQKQMMKQQQFESEYTRIINNLFKFVEKVVDKQVAPVMLLSPMMNSDAYQEKKQLAPLWYWPLDKSSGHFLSKTTRQINIVSNVDIAPTILANFNIDKPKEMVGHPLEYKQQAEDRTKFLKELQLIFTVFETRGMVLSSYITLLIVLLVGSTLFLWKKQMGKMWITFGKVIILAIISSPFWFLVSSYALKYIDVGSFVLGITLLSLGTGWLFTKYIPNPLVSLSFLLFLTITVDLFLGTPLMQRSYLGYDPVIGARYYGIGNEYAGVYLIAALFVMIPFFLYGRKGFSIIVFIFVFLIVQFAAPMLGTNAGATLSTVVAFSFILYQKFLKQRSFQYQLSMFAMAAVVAFLFLYIIQATEEASHIGYAFRRLLAGDFVYIVDMIERKISMNWKIFKYSNWTQLFVTTYVLIGFLLWRYKDKFSSGAGKTVLQTGIIASIALLVLNDSGVVAAATSMFLLVSASLYWIFEKKEKEALL